LNVCDDTFECVPWLIWTCAMTHLNVCRDAFECVPWLICTCAVTHLYVWHDSFTWDTCSIGHVNHIHEISNLFCGFYSYVWGSSVSICTRNSLIHINVIHTNESWHTFKRVMSHIQMSPWHKWIESTELMWIIFLWILFICTYGVALASRID